MNYPNYLVIPDIHGQISQYNQVELYIKKVLQEDFGIHIIFLGDYIDRGKDGILEVYYANEDDYVEKYFLDIGSRLVVEKLFELEKYFIENNVKYTFLMGNHEDSFIGNIKNLESFEAKKSTDSSKDYISMYQSIVGFTQDFNLINKTVSFFEKMPCYYNDDNNKLFFVHAGINPDKEIVENTKSEYLNIREKFFTSCKVFSHQIIFGHTPMDIIKDTECIHDKYKIIFQKDRIGLDSGNYRNGYINILRILNSNYTLIKIDDTGIKSNFVLNTTVDF